MNKFKVGDKVLFNAGYGWIEVVILGLTSKGTWVFEYMDNNLVGGLDYGLVHKQDEYFKPIPTEEEKLVDEMCEAFPFDDSYERKLICQRLIKAGYRKVEPISIKELRDIHDKVDGCGMMVDLLVEHDHIIIEGT